jgi:uncharacterized membrane protein YkvA (DUF1232 family)
MRFFSWLRDKAGLLKREVLTLYFAVRDPRTPLTAKLVAGLVVAYALSPIDLIPDFIPVLGYLDDLVLVPLGIALALRMVPPAVLAAARTEAANLLQRPKNWFAAAVIVLLWLAATLAIAWWVAAQFSLI